MEVIFFVAYLIEFIIIIYIERRIWHTYCTPVICLSAPYTLILIVSIIYSYLSPNIKFEYISIIPWIVGVLLFWIPSLIINKWKINRIIYTNTKITITNFNPIIISLVILIGLLFIIRIRSLLSSGLIFGSDDFSEDFSSSGIYGHLQILFIIITIALIALYDRFPKSIWFALLILVIIPALSYNVKGWVLIPIIGGIICRLRTGVLKLSGSLVIKIAIFGCSIFFLSYILCMIIGSEDSTFSFEFISFLGEHLLFYLISGVESLSIDFQNGIIEQQNSDIIFTQFQNVYNYINNEPYVSNINPLYLSLGIGESNVRTLFGTLYIFGGPINYFLVTVILSIFTYTLFIFAVSNNIWVLSLYGFYSALLTMGWFEYYFSHLLIIEIPLFSIIIYILDVKLTIRK